MGILIGILILSLLVFVHELGHFLFAKKAGVRVETFSIGFGPKILRRRIGETEYCISAILFGGYVKMTGQEDVGGAGEKTLDPKDYRNKSLWQRVQIAFAGPLFNYLFALAALILLYTTGVREAGQVAPVVGRVADSSRALAAGFKEGDTLIRINKKIIDKWEDAVLEIALQPEKKLTVIVGRAQGRNTLALIPQKTGREGIGVSGLYPSETAVLGEVVPGSPAEAAGLKKGDTVLALNGKPVPSWGDVVETIARAESLAVTFTLKRGTETIILAVRPKYNAGEKRFMVGIQPTAVFVERRYPLGTSITRAFDRTFDDALMIWRFLKALVTTQVSVRGMAGPVGIVHITGQVARGGMDIFLLFLAMISVNLAVINLFPFLIITDGGVIFFLLLEAVRGRPLSESVQMRIQQVAVSAIIALFLLLTWNDIFRLIGGP
jgi:regulator of sigma E protease